MPTGAGDADVGWRITQYHEGGREVVVAEVFSDDLRAALDLAYENSMRGATTGDRSDG